MTTHSDDCPPAGARKREYHLPTDWELTLDRRGVRGMKTYWGLRLGLRTATMIALALIAGTWGGILLLGMWMGGLCNG